MAKHKWNKSNRWRHCVKCGCRHMKGRLYDQPDGTRTKKPEPCDERLLKKDKV